jgi:hypothetical protein
VVVGGGVVVVGGGVATTVHEVEIVLVVPSRDALTLKVCVPIATFG